MCLKHFLKFYFIANSWGHMHVRMWSCGHILLACKWSVEFQDTGVLIWWEWQFLCTWRVVLCMGIEYGLNPLTSVCLRILGPVSNWGPYQVGAHTNSGINTKSRSISIRGSIPGRGSHRTVTVMSWGKLLAKHHLAIGASFEIVTSVARSGFHLVKNIS